MFVDDGAVDAVGDDMQVIRLLGVCMQSQRLMIILEFAARGDLRTFLVDCQPSKKHSSLLSPFDLAKMAVDVANGMQFLSSLEFVHRDLAARYAE